MNLTHPTIDPYHCFHSSTESSKKWCIIAWKHFLTKLSSSQSGFREKRCTERAISEIINQIQPIWIESCTLAEYLLIYNLKGFWYSRPHSTYKETWPLWHSRNCEWLVYLLSYWSKANNWNWPLKQIKESDSIIWVSSRISPRASALPCLYMIFITAVTKWSSIYSQTIWIFYMQMKTSNPRNLW